MAERRRGLGRGIEALIPKARAIERPSDIFFPGAGEGPNQAEDSIDVAAAKRAATPGRRGRATDAAKPNVRRKVAEGSGIAQNPKATDAELKIKDADTITGLMQPELAEASKPSEDLAPQLASNSTAKSVATEDGSQAQKQDYLRKPVGEELAKATASSKKTPIVRGTVRTDASASVAEIGTETGNETETGVSQISTTDQLNSDLGSSDELSGPTEGQYQGQLADQPLGQLAGQSIAAGALSSEPELTPVPGLTIAELKLADISPNTRQPRSVFDEDDLAELASSIQEVGLLQPIVVRTAEPKLGTPYELIMGERRWRASQLAGMTTIPAIIKATEDEDLLRDALLENLHRANLNPLEEASAYRQLLDDFHCTHDELARRIARSRPQISNTLRLLKLPVLVQRRVAASVLSAGHARALLGLPDAAAMERLAQRIVAEGLSVRATEEIIAIGDEPVQSERKQRLVSQRWKPALTQVATDLSDRFDTRVKVAMGQRKGRITVDFAGIDDLDRILQILAPGHPKLDADEK